MHLLMSYSGCVGTLMADTGIVQILGVAFGGVLKMVTGKKFPQNVRALRILVEELLGPVFEKNHLESMLDLKKTLDEISSESRTAKLWVDCLIKPVFTMLKYIRAEREADWVLHLQTVRELMPLFFAARHTHYARYALYYLCSMEEMPCEVRKYFMDGEHTVHHKTTGLFNGIWTDMAIETTFMRYGKGRNGIIGITLKPGTLKTWVYSLHACNGIINDLNEMSDEERPPAHTYHKEEMSARMKQDEQDRHTLRDKSNLCIDPLDPDQHPSDGLVNIVTGMVVTHPSVNVHNAVKLGQTQIKSFKKTWPGGFHDTIHKIVNTMSFSRNLKLEKSKVFDTETIYARAMTLQATSRGIDPENLLAHELAPYPTSMFDVDGHMREAKTKSTLKNTLKVDISSRSAERGTDATFLDGCAVLWVLPWPTSGTV